MTIPDENNLICACEAHLRAECRTERFFTNAEGKLYCLWHYPGVLNSETPFICDCSIASRSACKTQKFYKSYEGKNYCVLHYPGSYKIRDFRIAIKKKLERIDFDFRGVWFPEDADFKDVVFCEDADFSNTHFEATADFAKAIFNGNAYFTSAKFEGEAIFQPVRFNKLARFLRAEFKARVMFSHTWFGADAEFEGAKFYVEDYFDYAVFNGAANFIGSNFESGAVAHFPQATFNGAANFGHVTSDSYANFSNAVFSEKANFGGSTFTSGNFRSATFNEVASFSGVNFSASVYFNACVFSQAVDFRSTVFNSDVFFSEAIFKDFARFSGTKESKVFGEKPRLDFQHARIEKPERVSFHTLNLRPHWFINVDSRKFEFVDVDWNYQFKDELQSAREINVSSPSSLLSRAFRQLASNTEDIHRYRQASRFRYNAFDARRIEKFRGFVPWRLDWWYWLASGYGESVVRAALVFIALLVLFMFGYQRSEFMPVAATVTPPTIVLVQGDQPAVPELAPKRLGWREAALYSFNVGLLQKPEPKPKGLWSSFLVALQTVLGPAQAALLALAVRRRFMR